MTSMAKSPNHIAPGPHDIPAWSVEKGEPVPFFNVSIDAEQPDPVVLYVHSRHAEGSISVGMTAQAARLLAARLSEAAEDAK